ncbi:MAG: M43 family zinc metalloprotease [Bacteroidia bacterium]|jgi:hypothetical protein
MKKMYKLALALFLGISVGVSAQRQCGTMENLQMLIDNNPSIIEQMQAVEEHTRHVEEHGLAPRVVINIPTVFHIVYKNSTENISDAQIQSQLTVLNNDFRKLNSDASLIPSLFAGVAADMEFNFCMAQRTPSGAAFNGINRVASTRTTSFGSGNNVKQSSTGGTPGWDPNKYLNVWVCDIGGGILGYATFPGTATATTDGVVCDYRYFGTTGTATAPFNKGRTATHEVGHWLNLRHIWGDQNCGSDLVNDTPTHQTANYGCPAYPKNNNCTGGGTEMTMNYMDYVDDACMYMFSAGQKARSVALFAAGGLRAALLTSDGCTPVTPGACNTPAGLASSNVTSTTATVSWGSVSGALSYNLEYKTAAATSWTLFNTTSTAVNLSGLTASTTYNFRVTTVCSNGNSAVSAAASFTTQAVSTCTDNYEPNESRTAALTIPLATNITARIGTSTDKDYFKFNNTSSARNVKVTLTNLPADYDLELFRGSSRVRTSVNGGTTPETCIYNNSQSATTYTAYVYGYNGAFNASSCYTLRAEISSSSFVRTGDETEATDMEVFGDDRLSVYPNPSNGVLNIRINPESDLTQTVQVFNHLGQIVESYELSFTKSQPAVVVSLNDLNDGMYFVRVFDGQEVQTRRIMLRK